MYNFFIIVEINIINIYKETKINFFILKDKKRKEINSHKIIQQFY